MKLVIGNYNYSSWSLRAWLYLRESGLDPEVVRVPLFSGDWRERLRELSPSGRVPVLLDGEATVWDSLAIIEHVRETRSGALDWPRSGSARALARSASAEMHSGFAALREELPQNLRARRPLAIESLSGAARADVARVEEIFASCREGYGHGGPWLCGAKSIVDIVFAPVALRFRSYAIPLSRHVGDYLDAVLALDSLAEWQRRAEAETERIDFVDRLVPAAEAGLRLG